MCVPVSVCVCVCVCGMGVAFVYVQHNILFAYTRCIRNICLAFIIWAIGKRRQCQQ